MTLPYEHHVFVCTNRRPDGHARGSCAARGSESLKDALKAKVKEAGIAGVRINASGCLDFCERGPVVCDYPRNSWWGGMTVDAVAEFVRGLKSDADICRSNRLSDEDLRRGKPV